MNYGIGRPPAVENARCADCGGDRTHASTIRPDGTVVRRCCSCFAAYYLTFHPAPVREEVHD